MAGKLLTFEYLAQRFQQRDTSSQELLLFVAPAADIRKWAGVPRKTFDYQHGFQRTLNPSRVGEISDYFVEAKENISPTSIVVGFTAQNDMVKVNPASDTESTGQTALVQISIRLPDFENEPLPSLIALALRALESRLPTATVDEVKANAPQALATALAMQDEEAVDEEFGIYDEPSVTDGQSIEPGLEEPARSYLADFYAELLGQARGLAAAPDEDQLRQILYSLLKPAIIVDGQHRVFGAANADESIRLAVCALAQSDWPENVYQFVVINQKARPIKPAFLNSIIATSLTESEITMVYERLQVSRIDVEKAQIMNRVNTDPDSPFQGMIDFEIEGSQGFLQFPGMSKLLKDFQAIPRSRPGLLPNRIWDDVTGDWLTHFYGLWQGVKNYFAGRDPRLWEKPTESNSNNLLKIVTLQEVQGMMLDNWADGRMFTFTVHSQTVEAAQKWWSEFPSTFFTDDWKKKGLQTSVGRQILRSAITETRRNIGRRNWGHRRLGLFQEQ